MPMFIPDKTDFQPSSEALERWLSARKSNFNIGGAMMPQFFSDTGNSTDSNWFLVACIGEFIGLASTVYGGMRNGGIFLIFATLCIIMFIFCDFFFAVKLHRNIAKECKIHTLMLLEDDKNKQRLAELNLESGKGKFVDFLLQTGIILIALIKVIGIVLLGVFNNLVLYIPFAVIYFIVAYVHLKHTGYYFAYRASQNKIMEEHIKFAKGEFKAQVHKEPIITPNKLKNMPIKFNPHEIIKDEEVSRETAYVIIARGVLTDDDIQNLLAGQDSNDKIPLFKACRKLQVESYGVSF